MLSTKHMPKLCAIPRTFRRGRRQAEEQRETEQENPHAGEEMKNRKSKKQQRVKMMVSLEERRIEPLT